MERDSNSGSLAGVGLDVGLEYHKVIDYDRKAMRKALREGAAIIRKEGRRLVSRRAISNPGEFPGMQSGELRRAIGIVSRGSKGGWVKVGIRSIKGSVFYPAFLYYGSTKTGLAKRGNFMEKALQNSQAPVRAHVRGALKNALVPR
jgi:hypothetical protein